MMKNKILLFTVILSAALTAGCGKTGEQDAVPQTEKVQEETPSEALQEDSESGDVQDELQAEPGFSFADVADREFYFSSGAGGWYTVLYIHEDGTFSGHYQDSDMGDSAPEYPNGTMYYSEFSGSFTEPEKVNDTVYAFQIASIEYPLGFGDEIKDGIHYCYSEAYGLDEAEDFYMYLPGSKLADLPESYRGWVGYYNLDDITETELPFYGLYNVNKETGFSSNTYEESLLPAEESDAGDAYREAEQVIKSAEKRAAELEAESQNAQTQADLNSISGEIYTVWDDALNEVWGLLKENLDSEAMETVTEEERAWIAGKEEAVAEAGAEAEGGSMYSMVVNSRSAELTKERVYELLEYLK